MTLVLAFLAAAIVLAVTPGPGIAYVVARTAAGGRAEGLASCIGTAIGGLAHVAAATLGLSTLMLESATAFAIVKYAGAAYLIVMGVRMLRRTTGESETPILSAMGVRRALRDGVLVEAFNVKTAMFFLAFLPQFVDPLRGVAVQLALMGGVCVLLNTLVDVAAVLGAHRLLKSDGARRRRERLLTKTSGLTMIGLGVAVGLARRD